MTDKTLDIVDFVNQIRMRFPNETVITDAWIVERGLEPLDSPYHWVEAFADRTTEAVRTENWVLVREHTEFISDLMSQGSEAIEQLVDVSYAENLMWDLGRPAKIQAWPHIAPLIRQLYDQMWGAP